MYYILCRGTTLRCVVANGSVILHEFGLECCSTVRPYLVRRGEDPYLLVYPRSLQRRDLEVKRYLARQEETEEREEWSGRCTPLTICPAECPNKLRLLGCQR